MEQSRACRFWARGCWAAALVSVSAGFSAWAVDLPDPVIWWDMEAVSNGKVADKSGNGRDLTLGAGVSLTNGCGGATGHALFFEGQTTTWAQFSSPALGSRTIAFWYRRERGSGPISNAAGNTYPYLIANLSTIRMHFANATDNNVSSSIFAENPDTTRNRYFTSTPSLYREVWTHVTLTFDVTSTEADEAESDKIISHVTYKAYVNGACVAAPATDFALTNFAVAGTAMLGNWSANGTGIRPSYGALDEFRVWDTALDAEQVWAEYARTKENYDETGLVGRWTFDDTETVNGSLVLKNVAGSAGDITCGAGIVVTNAGVEGQCVACSGYKDCWGALTLPAALSSDFTWTCWINQSPDSSKDTLAKIGGDGQNKGPRLLQAGGDWYYINLKGAMPGEWDWTRTLVLTPGNNTEQTILNSRAPQGMWSHLAVTTRFKMAADGTRKAYTYAYMNGEYAGAIAERNLGPNAASASWTFANSGCNGANRPIEGMVDDLRLYAGALSSNTIVRLFRGAAAVDAGADFSVAGEMAELHGEIGKSAPGDVRKGYAGTPCWTLVSAPAGGEDVTILQPGRTVAQVTLPVEGAYVFRLSNTLDDVGLSRSDDVTVTRVAAVGTAPTVSVTATATTAVDEPCALMATTTAGARIHWAKVSGPGGAWFEPENAAATKATFDVAGMYVVRCTAEMNGASATADVTVTVGDGETCDLSNGLIRWWPLSGADFTKERIANSTRPTMGTNTDGVVIRAFETGPAGYAMRANGFKAYFDLGNGLAETQSIANNNNSPPTERYRAVSAWVWHDSSDTNMFKNAAIFMVPFTLGLWYNYNVGDGTADGLLLCQQGWGVNDTTIAYMKRPYALPHPLTDRWTHIYALFDRSQGTDFELWIDGEKQTPTSTPAGKRGRVRTTPFDVGGIDYSASDVGADNGYSRNSQNNAVMTRCFPGKVADVRIYNRKLTAREVKKLAADPDVAANRAPAIDPFEKATVVSATKKAKAVATAVFDDGEPTGGELTYEWSVLSGDAPAASFGDATARETTFTATAVGTYVLQLAVSDGERTSYSAPLTVEVVTAGTIVVIK